LNHGILNGSNVTALEASDGAFREVGLVWRNGTTRMQLFREVAKLIAPLLPQPVAIEKV